MPTVATNQWTSSLNLQRLHQLGELPLYVYGVNRYRVSRDFTSPLPLFTLSPFLISWEYHNHSSYFLFSFCPPTTSFHIPSPLSHLACALFYLLFWTPLDINNIQYRPWGQHFFLLFSTVTPLLLGNSVFVREAVDMLYWHSNYGKEQLGRGRDSCPHHSTKSVYR